MKKVLILMLVFGMASAANAIVYSLSGATLTETGTISVDVTGATADVYLALVIQSPGVVSPTGGADMLVGPAAPTLSGWVMDAPVSADDGEIWMFGTAPAELYVDGSWLTAGWSGATSLVDIILYSTPDGQTYNEQARATVGVPEPMTIALLGLGGLFLRRRTNRA